MSRGLKLSRVRLLPRCFRFRAVPILHALSGKILVAALHSTLGSHRNNFVEGLSRKIPFAKDFVQRIGVEFVLASESHHTCKNSRDELLLFIVEAEDRTWEQSP